MGLNTLQYQRQVCATEMDKWEIPPDFVNRSNPVQVENWTWQIYQDKRGKSKEKYTKLFYLWVKDMKKKSGWNKKQHSASLTRFQWWLFSYRHWLYTCWLWRFRKTTETHTLIIDKPDTQQLTCFLCITTNPQVMRVHAYIWVYLDVWTCMCLCLCVSVCVRVCASLCVGDNSSPKLTGIWRWQLF